jgi:predicted RNA methylase
MKIADLTESSGYSLEGSYTPDLVFSKLWLINELARIQPHVTVMYVLGSWYGNLAMLIDKSRDLEVDHIINVETNPEFLKTSEKILHSHGVRNIESMLKDVNRLNYKQLDRNSAVVNTSLNDIKSVDWFKHIPTGTLVVMQARDQVENEQFGGPEDIQQKFPLSQVLYSGSLDLEDPETEYRRFMTIGIK